MLLLVFNLVILVMLLLPGGVCRANNVEILAFKYPPLVIDENQGILPQIIIKSAKNANLDVKITVRSRKRAIREFEVTDSYLFLGESRYFPDIMENLSTQALMFSRIVLVYKKEKFQPTMSDYLKQFRGKSIGVSLGSYLTPVFKENGWEVQIAPKPEYNLNKLIIDRIDFWGTVGLTAIGLLNEQFPVSGNDFDMLEIEKFVIELMVRKNSKLQPVFDSLSKGFLKTVQTGQYKNILEQYYGVGKLPVSVMVK